eukprot:4232-Heterococcus_DN1.PRE.6
MAKPVRPLAASAVAASILPERSANISVSVATIVNSIVRSAVVAIVRASSILLVVLNADSRAITSNAFTFCID